MKNLIAAMAIMLVVFGALRGIYQTNTTRWILNPEPRAWDGLCLETDWQ